MKIEIKKKSQSHCEYTLTRTNKSVEHIALETKTYFVHDICHYVVEKNLQYSKGFWGMLSQGHTFNDLFGKENPQTTELRIIEQIVGPIQSVHLGHIPIQNFEQSISHLNFTVPENILYTCLVEINTIIESWGQLQVGQQLTLEWKL